jgi:hypothetical protein
LREQKKIQKKEEKKKKMQESKYHNMQERVLDLTFTKGGEEEGEEEEEIKKYNIEEMEERLKYFQDLEEYKVIPIIYKRKTESPIKSYNLFLPIIDDFEIIKNEEYVIVLGLFIGPYFLRYNLIKKKLG